MRKNVYNMVSLLISFLLVVGRVQVKESNSFYQTI